MVMMGLTRLARRPTALLVFLFSIASLAVMPTALCCQAITSAAIGEDDVCPHEGVHGEACPMHRPAPSDDDGRLSLEPCHSPDPLLAGLLTLTGAMPEHARLDAVQFVGQPLDAEESIAIDPLSVQPHAPPPRV